MYREGSSDLENLFVCPATKLPLTQVPREEAERLMGGELKARAVLPNARGIDSKPAGVTETVLLREDLSCAYPIVDGIPVLLAPESLAIDSELLQFDLTDPRYAEAYEEMAFYDSRASSTIEKLETGGAESILPTEMAATENERRTFPAPWSRWVDTPHDLAAQWEGYEHLEVAGKRVMQLGGSGTHAIKFAMAGAAEAWLITPMLDEARIAARLAHSVGVGGRFHVAVAIAEELPIVSNSFDGIYTGGCLHHTVTDLALPESARVLRPGGRFAATEPWRAPLYGIGTRLLGKREDAYCRPLTGPRLASLDSSFSSSKRIQHGTLTRYPLIALEKFGLPTMKRLHWYLGKFDDAACSLIPGMRKFGGSIAILSIK